MNGKEKMKLARLEAVKRLHMLANELEAGTVHLGNKKYPVPDQVRFELKVEDDELEIDLKWIDRDEHKELQV